MDILDLPGLVSVGQPEIDDDDRTCILKAESPEVQKDCVKCGTVGTLDSSGSRNRTYRDSPIRKHRIVISLKVLRFKCRSCGHTFAQQVEGMDPTRHMTTRCVEWIRERCLRDTFAHVAEHIGCDEKTVRDIAHTYIDELQDKYRPYLPEWLGIDEAFLDGKNRCVLTDIGQRRPIDLLEDCEIGRIVGWLSSFKDSSHLKGVTMDMWRPFQRAVDGVFPNVPVVIDKFHVLKMANTALDSIRTTLAKSRTAEAKTGIEKRLAREQGREWMRNKALLLRRPYNASQNEAEKLELWFAGEPELKAAYALKEAFWNLYEPGRAKYEAAIALDIWCDSVPKHLRGKGKPFQPLLTATKNWRTEILAYFDHRQTNAYTEALTGVINRHEGGYSFDVLRARILFARPTPPVNSIG